MRTSNNIITQRRIADAVIAVVNGAPSGAPGTLLYPPLSEHLTEAEFTQMMRLLVETKRIAKQGDRYYPRRDQ